MGLSVTKKGGFSFNRKKANLRKEEFQISRSWWFKVVVQSVEYIYMTITVIV